MVVIRGPDYPPHHLHRPGSLCRCIQPPVLIFTVQPLPNATDSPLCTPPTVTFPGPPPLIPGGLDYRSAPPRP